MLSRVLGLVLTAVMGGSGTAKDALELEQLQTFRNRQRLQPRTRGSNRRSAALIDLELGAIERGTRAKSRGPYPQHLIDNCQAMRRRNGVSL